MKTYGRFEVGIFNLDARWNSAVIFTFRPLYSRQKAARYHLNRKLGDPQSRWRENILLLTGIKSTDLSVV
jgi:hypothetical protein